MRARGPLFWVAYSFVFAGFCTGWTFAYTGDQRGLFAFAFAVLGAGHFVMGCLWMQRVREWAGPRGSL